MLITLAAKDFRNRLYEEAKEKKQRGKKHKNSPFKDGPDEGRLAAMLESGEFASPADHDIKATRPIADLCKLPLPLWCSKT